MFSGPIMLDQRATIYQRDYRTGRLDEVVKENLRCRLVHIMKEPYDTNQERSEYANRRRMIWDPDYDMPQHGIQVEVDDERWNVIAGTFDRVRQYNGRSFFRRCDVAKVMNND